MLDSRKHRQYCITLYGKPRRQEKRQQTLLLRRRKCPRRRQAPHRPSGLPRHRRKTRRDGPRSHRPRPPGRHHPRVRFARRPLVCGSKNWRLGPAAIPLATPRSGPSPAHYLLLAAIHRICQPGPKTEVPDWYRSSILSSLWEFPPERFTSQAFWDAFEQILPEGPEPLSPADDPLEQAQLRLLGVWKEKQLVSRRLLAYDTTNFYTYIASTNSRNQLAQRGHNKQGRHNLRQVGLSYVLDGEHGLSLCHHVYPGNVADVEEFSTALTRITRMLDKNQIARETVTLVLDKGSAALANTVALEEAG